MKGVINHNKLTIGIICVSLALYALISVFSKPLTTPEGDALKKIIVPTQGKDVKKFDMKATAKALNNPSKTLDYSLVFPSSVVRETKNDGRTTNFYFNGVRVASLSFVYNDKKTYTPLSYAENVLGKKIPLAIDSKEVTIGSHVYLSAGASESYFRIASMKGGTWLGALEILNDNQNFEKVLLESLSVQ